MRKPAKNVSSAGQEMADFCGKWARGGSPAAKKMHWTDRSVQPARGSKGETPGSGARRIMTFPDTGIPSRRAGPSGMRDLGNDAQADEKCARRRAGNGGFLRKTASVGVYSFCIERSFQKQRPNGRVRRAAGGSQRTGRGGGRGATSRRGRPPRPGPAHTQQGALQGALQGGRRALDIARRRFDIPAHDGADDHDGNHHRDLLRRAVTSGAQPTGPATLPAEARRVF